MKDSFVTVDGTRIHYVEEGEGRPLLYVHGNTGSSRWFSKVMDLPGFRTVALDLPNFGRSEPLAGPVELGRYADIVARFAGAVGLEKPILVAHSLGGAVALLLAARHPGSFSGMVLVDSGPPSGLVTPEDKHPFYESLRSNRALLAQVLRFQVPSMKDEALFQALVDDALLMAQPAWVGHAVALSHFDLRGKLGGYRGPVLVLRGALDALITESMARETAEAFQDAALRTLEGVGHSAMVEDPEAFKRAVLAFAEDRVARNN